MSQNGEQVFFNESGIYISQFRFVTTGGRTYPTRTLQSTYVSLERPWGCLANISVVFLWLLGIVAMFPLIFGAVNLLIWYAAKEVAIGAVGPSWVVVILSATVIVVVILGLRITSARRRRQWTANFMFAGGGDFGTTSYSSSNSNSITSSTFSTSTISSSSTTRRPDFSVWSYDRQWTERLIAAANEAMVAAQQT